MSNQPIKRTPQQQIEHLGEKRITFSYSTQEEALEYLKINNNYFKLRAYRKGFPQRPDGTYIGLDFEYLKDLSINDMLLRYCLLHMCLDVEHFEKVAMMRRFDESDEDGYSIVQDFIKKENNKACAQEDRDACKNSDDEICSLFREVKSSAYCVDLFNKFECKMPIWAFIEVLSFGSFLHFFRFFAEQLKDKDMTDEWYLLKSVKSIRNAAAHSNCVLNDLSPNTRKHRPNYNVMDYMGRMGITKTTRENKMSCEKLYQIATLFYVYDKIMPKKGMREYRIKDLQAVIKRMFLHIEYYDKCEMIESSFIIIKKLVDNLSKSVI